jgi:hypothetical protein
VKVNNKVESGDMALIELTMIYSHHIKVDSLNFQFINGVLQLKCIFIDGAISSISELLRYDSGGALY